MQAAALITAAGSSTRFNSSEAPGKKELIPIDGKSSIERCVLSCSVLPYIELIVITHPEGDSTTIDHISMIADKYDMKFISAPGGSTRQLSVLNGLRAMEAYAPEMVIIHDGARPWISPELIDTAYRKAQEVGGAAPGLPSRNALKQIDEHGMITGHYQRERIIEIQTPQIFTYRDILQAHLAASEADKPYIDDTEIFTDFGGRVAVIPGDPDNLKITYAGDLRGNL